MSGFERAQRGTSKRSRPLGRFRSRTLRLRSPARAGWRAGPCGASLSAG